MPQLSDINVKNLTEKMIEYSAKSTRRIFVALLDGKPLKGIRAYGSKSALSCAVNGLIRDLALKIYPVPAHFNDYDHRRNWFHECYSKMMDVRDQLIESGRLQYTELTDLKHNEHTLKKNDTLEEG